MIISHKKRIAYFRVPKTGSTTVSLMLRMCGGIREDDIASSTPMGHFPSLNCIAPTAGKIDDDDAVGQHITPQQAFDKGLLTMDQLREFRCIVFLRDPYERYISGIMHSAGRHVELKHIHLAMNNTLPSADRGALKNKGLLAIPQANYYYVNGEIIAEPFAFGDYVNSTKRLIRLFGGIDFPVIPRMNAHQAWKDKWTVEEMWLDEHRARFEATYFEDLRLFAAFDLWPPEPNPNYKAYDVKRGFQDAKIGTDSTSINRLYKQSTPRIIREAM